VKFTLVLLGSSRVMLQRDSLCDADFEHCLEQLQSLGQTIQAKIDVHGMIARAFSLQLQHLAVSDVRTKVDWCSCRLGVDTYGSAV
jgi:hypothetical protein